MIGTTGLGWLLSMAKSADSTWGVVEQFYKELEARVEPRWESWVRESEVWGTLRSLDCKPCRGDGVAFYHSQRAGYPSGDVFKRKPRISAIGVLQDIEVDGRHLQHMTVQFDRSLWNALKAHPIIRDESTSEIFRECGMVPGCVATFFPADKGAWGKIAKLANERVRRES